MYRKHRVINKEVSTNIKCNRCKGNKLVYKEDPNYGGEEVYCTSCKKFCR